MTESKKSWQAQSSTGKRVLDQVRIQDKCPIPWNSMEGNDQVRFCGECQRQVWNFTEMTDTEILEVLRTNPDRLCAQIVKTMDGRLVTRSYPVRQEPKTTFRFSMLGMMIFSTILSPLLIIAPALYHWLVRQPMVGIVEVTEQELREGGMAISMSELMQRYAEERVERSRTAEANQDQVSQSSGVDRPTFRRL